MKLTPTKIARAMELKPFQTDGRLVLDTRGIHHTVKPFRNFAHATEIHAAEKNLASAEGLFIVEKLAASGIVQPHMEVLSHEAVLQSFRATGGKQAAHAIPCQVVID